MLTKSDLRDLRALDAWWKSVVVDDAVPTWRSILDKALEETGLREAWEAGEIEGRQALDLLHAVRLEGRRLFRSWAEELLAEVAPDSTKALVGGVRQAVGRFFGRMGRGVRELFAAGVLALAGPDPSVLDDPTVQEALAVEVDRQQQYLAKFADEIVRENKPLDGTFVARAEQYGASVWAGAQNTVRSVAVGKSVFKQERRIHIGPRSPEDPCGVCESQENQGWVPIGTLLSIGDSPCKSACHCSFLFRVDEHGPEHWAGRGPLHEPTFGATG